MALSVALTRSALAIELQKVETAPALVPLDTRIAGRTVAVKDATGRPMHRFQWPGVYFGAAFSGSAVYLTTGAGHAKFHVRIDNQPAVTWENPGPGLYRIDGLAHGRHTIRLDLVTECQGGPVDFGGFALAAGAKPIGLRSASRQIEFIGDSHTVGYGNTSKKRECTPEIVWATTDTTQAFGPIVAQHFGADYQINAISGRGVVRNYGGFAADTLPQSYPFALFDRQTPVDDHGWNPNVIVIGLGTNDFSTPLKPDEKWKSRQELQTDYERTYVQFVQQLREKYPHAFIVLAANDGAQGEIEAEVRKVAQLLTAAGDHRIGTVTFNALELTACDWHPSLADHQKMAATVIKFLAAHPEVWPLE